jgi:hypothetical protein
MKTAPTINYEKLDIEKFSVLSKCNIFASGLMRLSLA